MTDKTSFTRLRRLRTTETMRSLVRETSVAVTDLVYPIFVIEGSGIKHGRQNIRRLIIQ